MFLYGQLGDMPVDFLVCRFDIQLFRDFVHYEEYLELFFGLLLGACLQLLDILVNLLSVNALHHQVDILASQ